jgi:single-strand DNA-binding protein
MARHFIRVEFIGTIANDPELQHVGNNTPICKISVAVNRSQKKGNEWEEKTTWMRATFWKYQAEQIVNQAKKGDRIFIGGPMEQQEWTNKEGAKQTSYEVIVRDFVPLGRQQKKESSSQGSGYGSYDNQQGGYGGRQQAPAQQANNEGDDWFANAAQDMADKPPF